MTRPSARLGLESAFLVLTAVGMAAGNVGTTEHRSLVPTHLDHEVVAERRLHEKHPGSDDACFLVLSPELGRSGRGLWVDCDVLGVVDVGSRLRKDAGSDVLGVDGREVPLVRSADGRGMRAAMPLSVLAVLVPLAAFARRRTR